MLTASAPLQPKIQDWFKIVNSVPMIEVYGQTESGGGSFFTKQIDGTKGHVGGPSPCLEFKLVDIEEMNYTHKDKDQFGNPSPRGEICMRGPAMFKGYYGDE